MAADTIKINKTHAKMVAHRGLSGIETENTNLAFTAAGQRTYFGVETDVHVTLDGKYIIIHDDATGRVSEINLPVEGSNFADLRAIKLRDREDGVTREDIILPTLDDYIKICKRYGKISVLELKNYMPKENIKEIIDVIKARDYLENVIFISFDMRNCDAVREFLPEQAIQFLTVGLPDDNFFAHMAENKIGLDIHYNSLLQNPAEVEKYHKAGLMVNCWTVDGKEDGEALDKLGVDYITSNILE